MKFLFVIMTLIVSGCANSAADKPQPVLIAPSCAEIKPLRDKALQEFEDMSKWCTDAITAHMQCMGHQKFIGFVFDSCYTTKENKNRNCEAQQVMGNATHYLLTYYDALSRSQHCQ